LNIPLLVAISQATPSDRFYFFTESLWRRLLRQETAEPYFAALERCEANLRDHRIAAKVTFYVRILRTALCRATEPWIDRTLAFLKENEDQISGELEYELELTLQLDRYRRSAYLFVNGNATREKIDRAIRDFCTLDDQEAAERVVLAQLDLAANADAVLRAIPFDWSDWSTAYHTLRWISHETNNRLGIEREPPEHEMLWDTTVQFMKEVDRADNPNPWQWNSTLKGLVEFLALLILTPLAGLAATIVTGLIVDDWLHVHRTTSEGVHLVMVVWAVIATVAFCFLYLRPRTTNRWFNFRRRQIALRKYQQKWRYQTLRFVHKMQYPLEDVDSAITAAVHESPGYFSASTWLPHFVSHDFGLAFYTLALSYVR
jgi:hypothetical protein